MSKSCRASMLGEAHPKGREGGGYAVLVGAEKERAVTVKEWKAGAKKAVDVCGEAESRVDVLPDRGRRRWVVPSASWRAWRGIIFLLHNNNNQQIKSKCPLSDRELVSTSNKTQQTWPACEEPRRCARPSPPTITCAARTRPKTPWTKARTAWTRVRPPNPMEATRRSRPRSRKTLHASSSRSRTFHSASV
jgi:hypothetical protein